MRIENKTVQEFDKNWKLAKEKVREAGEKSKRRLEDKYDKKIIDIGDSVRMLSLPTKIGLKIKLRGDLWTGPFKVIGKLPSGNLKLNIYKKGDIGRKKPYITHPDRLKLAEEEYLPVSFEYSRKRKSPQGKTVRFDENLVFLEAKQMVVKKVVFDDAVVYI